MNPEECAAGLAGLLSAQAEVCREILERSSRQQDLVTAGNREDDLLVLLA